jgi:hypothetical protein
LVFFFFFFFFLFFILVVLEKSGLVYGSINGRPIDSS